MNRPTHRRDKKVIIYLPVLIGIIIMAIFISIEIFSLATEKEIPISDTISENSEVQNTVNETKNEVQNVIVPSMEEENKKNNFVKDTTALKQINTKTRKTSNGKKYTSIGLVNIPSLGIKYQILS